MCFGMSSAICITGLLSSFPFGHSPMGDMILPFPLSGSLSKGTFFLYFFPPQRLLFKSRECCHHDLYVEILIDG